MSFRDALRDGFVFLDGSMGTVLQAHQSRSGGPGWKVPEELNLTDPDLICKIHTGYLEAGATVILTNTFGANRFKLAETGYNAAEIVTLATRIARKAAAPYKDRYVALDISSTGKLLEPMGSCTFDEAYEAFAEMVRAGAEAGADLVAIETMSDLLELKAAVLAAKENCSLPVIASATFQDNNRTLTGADPLTVVTVMEGLGVDAVGFNCGGDLAHARSLVEAFVSCASVPVIMEPNAGIPVIEGGATVFKVSPGEFAETLAYGAGAGARVLGGCCGTTARHIAAMTAACSRLEPKPPAGFTATRVSSWSDTVEIGDDPIIVGERINPTGKKRFREAILAGDTDYALNEAKSQIEAGAHVLDVNVGLPGIDEAAVMTGMVRAIQRTFPVPLQIDSSEPAVLERALRYYNGKALVNSVNGKAKVMEAVFPIVKKYGGVVIGLALDDSGIPPTAEGRLAIARNIVETAEAFGINRKDVIIDTLTLTVSSQQKEAMETVRALSLVRSELGVRTVLGVSNISFGLPQRELVNSVFLAAALQGGLSACIINPLSAQMMSVYHTFRALAGYDTNCLEYIGRYVAQPAPANGSANGSTNVPLSQPAKGPATNADQARTGVSDEDLKTIITSGLRDRSAVAAEFLLRTKTPVEIIDGIIVPALDEVGRDFESGRKFLPQLLLSADTVSRAFEVIRAHLERNGGAPESKGKILMATVHGDIHDIGKNIVSAMLENYGYTVVDLGKNVSPEIVIEAASREAPGIIGLSALMTTTVASMEETIRDLRASGYTGKIMVGGAVLTKEYAERIGADYYAKDAMASVSIAKDIFGR